MLSILFVQPEHWEDVELRHLIALQAIVEEGSFWKASERLECSPSALSQQIATLERLVGHRLLERSRGRRQVVLTEPGRLLVRHADAIVARLRAAHADLTAFAEGAAGTLRIGTYQSVGAKIVPRLLREFAADWPSIDLRLTESANDDELLKLVERGELDLTFSFLPLPEGPFEATELMSDPYVLAVASDSPLARSRTARIGQIAGRQLVSFKQDRMTAHVEEHLRDAGIEPNVVFRSDDNGTVQGMVAAGVGVALVPALTLDENDPAIRVLEIDGMPPRVLALAWHRDRYRSPAALAFAARAKRICDGLATSAAHRRVERIAGVILAAGGSRRYGGRKLLAPLEGKPLLQHVLDAANASALGEVVLVVGDSADEVLAGVRAGRARVVVNEAHAGGQSTSLRAGLRAAGGADAVVVLLGDQPRVTPALIDALVERQRATGAAAVVSSAKGRRSPPTLLRRELWPALESLTGDVGAREILAGRRDVAVLEVTAPLGSLEDVDRPADLARVAKTRA